jgi:site-specific DNA recombinase
MYFFHENLTIDQNSTSADIMRWDIGIFVAKQYIGQLRDNIKRGIDRKLLDGEWTGKAPFGYINTTICDKIGNNGSLGKNKKWIVPDSTNSIYVQKIFNLYSTGKFPINLICEIINDFRNNDSLLTNKSIFTNKQIYAILRNSFYYGEMKSN